MNRLLLVSLGAAIALMAAGSERADAQYNPYFPSASQQRPFGPLPYSQSPISPYLNLAPNNRLSTNYFLGTLPEFDRRANNFLFSSAIYNLDQRMSYPAQRPDGIGPTLNETGHPVYFGNYGTYYYLPQYGRGQTQAGGQTSAAPRPR
jgi:hypothetical protein